MADRRHDAGRHTDDDRDQQRAERQLDRRRKIGREFSGDRLRVGDRAAEIAVQQRVEVRADLRVPGPIEPQLVGERGRLLRRGVLAESQRNRISRNQVQERKAHQHDRDEDEDEPQQPLGDEARHQANAAAIEKRAACR